MATMDTLAAQYAGIGKIQKVSAAEEAQIISALGAVKSSIQTVYDRNAGVSFYNGWDKLNTIFGEMENCLIRSNFTGIASYGKLLSDTRFFHSLRSTALFTVVSVFFELVFGMALALIMNKAIKGIGRCAHNRADTMGDSDRCLRAHVELYVRRQQRCCCACVCEYRSDRLAGADAALKRGRDERRNSRGCLEDDAVYGAAVARRATDHRPGVFMRAQKLTARVPHAHFSASRCRC